MRLKLVWLPLTVLIVVGCLATVVQSLQRADEHTLDTDSRFRERIVNPADGLNEATVTISASSVNSPELEAIDEVTDVLDAPQPESASTQLALNPHAYLDERRDEPWASQKQATIYDAISTIPGGASSIMVDCRTTLCRVEIISDPTCIMIDSDDPEYTDVVERQLIEHIQIELMLSRASGSDTHTISCDGEPGFFMTLHFDRLPTDIEDSSEGG